MNDKRVWVYVGMQFTFSKSKDIQYIHDIAQCTAMKPWDRISTWLHQIFFGICVDVQVKKFKKPQALQNSL